MLAISVGHYPESPGACWDGLCEHKIAVRWRMFIIAMLQERIPYLAVPVGSLRSKVGFINEHHADLAVELHFNSAGGQGAGCETLYYPGSKRGKVFATFIQNHLAQVFFPNRGIKEGWYRMDRPGIKDYEGDVEGDEQPDYFLRKTMCPAIILEPEFMHNMNMIRDMEMEACQVIADQLVAAHTELVRTHG